MKINGVLAMENEYSTGKLYDFVARSESLEEYKALLVRLADQRESWVGVVNKIMEANSLSAKRMGELCGVSRQSVQKWLKGSVPKKRETYIKIGFAAGYDLEQMNHFLQRYGGFNKLYPKCLEDSVYIFVLSSDCIEHSYKSCEQIIQMLKDEMSSDNDNDDLDSYTTSALEFNFTNMKSLQEMLVFVAENSEVYRQQYIKLYDYIEEFIQKNLLPDGDDNVFQLANSQQWSSSLRQCVSNISQRKWYPQRNKIISLGIHLNMDADEINHMLDLAQMEHLCAKSPFESAIIYALENAKLEDMIYCDGTDDLCLYVKNILLSLNIEGAEAFMEELPEEDY